MIEYNKQPNKIISGKYKPIHDFGINDTVNIDTSVVESFGEEWEKFYNFDTDEIEQIGKEYFGFLDKNIINSNTTVLDVGCGTGRWTKYLSSRVKSIEAIDPSKAIYFADELLKDTKNVRLSIASTESIPFEDGTFDFVMSVGVLHHIPDTQKAMKDCVKKVKKGGFFYVYLYYALDNRGLLYKMIFKASDVIRRIVSKLPSDTKKLVCDLLALTIYVPFVTIGRFLHFVGLEKIASLLPLSAYQDKSLFVMRNDALDRFGTALEQRFTKEQIKNMMQNSGLSNIIIPDGPVLWAAVGEKK
jgi:ubiquinone/menaquinone biosynthesis C-methylase UbiE